MAYRVAERTCRAMAFAAIAAACLCAPAAAELEPVGLGARGVDVRAALRTDLDVRDAFNRPVSARLVERELAQGRAAADPSRLVSRLPGAQALWDVLNRVLLAVGLRGGRPSAGHATPLGRALRLAKVDLRLAAVFAVLGALLAQSLCLRPAAAVPVPASGRPRILRC